MDLGGHGRLVAPASGKSQQQEGTNPKGSAQGMAAKTGPSYQMSHTHRDKIKNSNILNALIEHAEGSREMSGSQVTAGLGLLKKILPDLQPVDPDTGKGGVTIHLPARTNDIL